MTPTRPPNTMIISGSMTLVIPATRVSTSSSRISAYLKSRVSSAPVSSPIITREVNMSGTIVCRLIALPRLLPSRTSPRISPMASSKIEFPATSDASCSESSSCTPAPSDDDSVVAIRATADERKRLPNIGILKSRRSFRRRNCFDFFRRFRAKTEPPMTTGIQRT